MPGTILRRTTGHVLRPPRSRPKLISTQTRPAACPGTTSASPGARPASAAMTLRRQRQAESLGDRCRQQVAKRLVKRASSCRVRLISGTSTKPARRPRPAPRRLADRSRSCPEPVTPQQLGARGRPGLRPRSDPLLVGAEVGRTWRRRRCSCICRRGPAGGFARGLGWLRRRLRRCGQAEQ